MRVSTHVYHVFRHRNEGQPTHRCRHARVAITNSGGPRDGTTTFPPRFKRQQQCKRVLVAGCIIVRAPCAGTIEGRTPFENHPVDPGITLCYSSRNYDSTIEHYDSTIEHYDSTIEHYRALRGVADRCPPRLDENMQ